ncbi:MAG: protein kinase, partial [Deltaproteobacteria bacterium]|nr:protein kinase [Deltaproteobacteria bacterium]
MSEGRRLGQYELIESLGAGGMGEVWRGRHLLLDRLAAVKLIRPDASGVGRDQLLERFLREARATSTLRSPHTVELYDFGVTDDGAFYYVMELLHGVDLRSMVDRHGPLGADRTIHMVRGVCESLDEAHQRGLLHRDIKPANIFASRLGLVFDFPKVLDFGLVKAITDTAVHGSQLTASNAVLGTPAFMAPELATGSTEVDARADLYALGCVMYWLLTGRLVFHADSAMAMVMAHLGEVPTPPSDHSELPIPPELRDVVMRCLEKNPKDRFSSAAELARTLADVPLEEPWTQARARKWWHTHLPGPAEDTNQAWSPRARDVSLSLETSGQATDAPFTNDGTGGRRWIPAVVAATVLLVAVIGVVGAFSGWFVPSPVPDSQTADQASAVTEHPVEPIGAPTAESTEASKEEPMIAPAAEPLPGPAANQPIDPPRKPRVEPVAEPAAEPVEESEPMAATEPIPASEPEAANRQTLAGIELGATLPSAREVQGGAARRPYTCVPYTPSRFDCRGYYTATREGWMPGSGTWLRRIATCEGRVVHAVELSKRWSPEATADQDDEIQASKNPQDDARATTAVVAAGLLAQGYARTKSESGNDGRRRGGAWEVAAFAVGATTATLR